MEKLSQRVRKKMPDGQVCGAQFLFATIRAKLAAYLGRASGALPAGILR